ncbi:MAG TPA: hypothetical protein VH951_10115 [Dehalococcoidia bacterium]|jgi:hypothetical protein
MAKTGFGGQHVPVSATLLMDLDKPLFSKVLDNRRDSSFCETELFGDLVNGGVGI